MREVLGTLLVLRAGSAGIQYSPPFREKPMSLRRMIPFILINIVVSATVFLVLLSWWEGRREGETVATPLAQVSPGIPTPQLVDFATPEQVQTDNDDVTPAEGVENESEGNDGPTTHVVQAGETLGVISQRYDVAVEDIAAANDITNVNAISVGQELIIPIGGLPTETPQPTPLPSPTAAPTGTPTVSPEEEEVLVTITEVVGLGDLTEEAVRITNSGSSPILLQGWELEDEDGNTYTFGSVTLFGSSDAGAPSILIHTEAGQNGPSDLFWGLESAVWEDGENVTLRDAQGAPHAEYTIP